MNDETPDPVADSLFKRPHGLGPKPPLPIEVVEGIIAWFENVRSRPQMFFPSLTPGIIGSGLYMFQMAFRHLAYDIEPDIDVAIQRGWERNALGPVYQMRQRGMTDEQIVDEFLVIEIETWRRVLAKLKSETL